MCDSELMALPDGVQKVATFLQAKEHLQAPVMLSDAARTAQQAADALGVKVGQIAKSIVFRRRLDDAAVLVVTSGDQRVDEQKLQALVCVDGTRLSRADAVFVKAKTGFSIGGVAPVAHSMPVVQLIDQSLFRFDQIWAAAGHPNAVFQLTPTDLQRLTGAPVADVAVKPDTQLGLQPQTEVPQSLQQFTRQDAINIIAFRARDYWSNGQITSPCISVCRMNATTHLCEGCFRTGDEIAVWSSANNAAKQAIWFQIAQRVDQQAAQQTNQQLDQPTNQQIVQPVSSRIVGNCI